MSDELLGLNLSESVPLAPSPAERAMTAGLFGGFAALCVSAILWLFLGTPFIPLRVADAIFAVLPISIVAFGVAFLGPWAKRFAFACCVAGYLVLLALVARMLARRAPEPALSHGALLGVVVWLVASLTVVPLAGGGAFGLGWGPNRWLSAGSLLASGLVYGICTVAALGRLNADDALARRGAGLLDRRTVFRGLIGAGVVVLAVEGFRTIVDALGIGSNAMVSGGSGVFPDIDGLSREVTPTADFYHVSKNVFDPEGPDPGWTLSIGGLVDRPMSLSLNELQSRPASEAFATLECIDNQVGGDLIGNALWRGVSLGDLLREAGPAAGAVDIVFRALDDYTDGISIEKALEPGALLAYDMNGAPLNSTHGAPLRLIAPGIFGMKNVKWITSVEVVATDYKGYWQRRGWDDRAPYQTMSRIDVARASGAGRPATIAGIAFAGDRGIARVEVSTDGGRTWTDAQLRPPLSPNAWVLWLYEWTPTAVGSYAVVVRATDGKGDVQTEKRAGPVPSGSTGWHSRTLDVRG